ncbi:MAG: GH92 family glycosyl hydrolase [Bacteroidales bacterium]|nr:GH92 family glycosyl hydrolase [Bacteroidales bacterium]
MMRITSRLRAFFLAITILSLSAMAVAQNYTQYVNPMVGTGGHGHTFPGALVPFGAVQLSPDTRLTGWDGCSAYHYSDNVVYGFSHTHLSGTGCSDYGDILVMPFTGTGSPVNTRYCARFSHADEKAMPGYYAVKLDNGIQVELTATTHVGCHRYSFPDDGQPHGIVIDLQHRDAVLESSIETVSPSEFVGHRVSRAWNEAQHAYFDLRLSQPVQRIQYYRDSIMMRTVSKLEGGNIKAVLYFADDVREVTLNVGISAVDVAGASANLSETPDFNFDRVHKEAENCWNRELGKIAVKGTLEDMRKFYTALYHCFTAPYEYSDVDGRYRGQDGKIHREKNHKVYTVFSLWDTYRALHPLLNLIDRERTNDFLNTFLLHYEQGGQLSMWELSAYETWCMIGYHSVPVILDASRKGIGDFDKRRMLQAMVASAELPKLGRPEFEQYEHIPADKEHESVSKTLEYCYDDWCIYQFAKDLGDKKTAERFHRRCQFYKNILDENGFMHPRMNGSFIAPFAPGEVNNHFTEANSWQYSTYVPHDFYTYMNLAGGKAHVAAMLDSLFFGVDEMSGRQQADLTGIIGKYAHGNEPGHHAPYMYDYVGQPWKTQQVVRMILDKLYSDTPDGLCGNEDCGQMSAWYVLSALGFYAVTPGSNQYAIGSPIFDEARIHLENGKTFTIITQKKGKENGYIESIRRNGQPYSEIFLTYDMIDNGDTFEFVMGDKPNQSYGKDGVRKPALPDSRVEPTMALAPVFGNPTAVFNDKTTVTIVPAHQQQTAPVIRYTTSQDDFKKERVYQGPITLTESTVIRAYAEYPNPLGRSAVVEASYHKMLHDKTVAIKGKYNPQYTAGGDQGLVDGLRGTVNWRLGGWQGYQGQDFEAVVDLQSVKKVSEVSVGFLEDIRSWIWFPKGVVVEVSVDGEKYIPFGEFKNPHPDNDYTIKTEDFTVRNNAQARYVRVRAANYGVLPEWHLGAGGEAFIFVDEINVKTDQ